MMFLHPEQNDSEQSHSETMFHFEVGEVYGRFFFFFMITIGSTEGIKMLLVISGDCFSVLK